MMEGWDEEDIYCRGNCGKCERCDDINDNIGDMQYEQYRYEEDDKLIRET
jgi:hypothetical protein